MKAAAVFALFASLVTHGVAQKGSDLVETHKKWLDEEVGYIITDRERAAFLELRSVEERDAFIEAFWRRRDPDPLTPENEFKDEHYRRIEHANRVLGRETPIPGWMTDRGRMYIILGAPRDRENFISAPGIYPAELWFYDPDPKRGLSSPFYLLFFQEGYAGEYRLYSPRVHGPQKLLTYSDFGENERMEAYQALRQISGDLAHASITFKADEGAIPGAVQGDSLSTDVLLAEIARSPTRAVDTRYVDAIARGRGIVETDYLFNYVASAASVDVLPGPRGLDQTSFVHWGIEIEPQDLTLVFDEDKKVYYTSLQIDLEVEATDPPAKVLQFDREEFIQLSPSEFAGVQARPFVYRSMFPLLPGRFQLRAIVKNRAVSQYTILEAEIEVPVRGPGEVQLGTPVLLYGAETAQGSTPADYRPYQVGTHRLDPNTKKVYAIGQELLAFIPLNGAGRQDRIRLRLFDRDGGAAVGEPREVPIGERGGAPVFASVPLEGLSGGRYRLEVQLEDPAGASLAKSEVDFDVSPRTAIARPWSLRWSPLEASTPGVVETALAEEYLRLGDRKTARSLFERALAVNGDLAVPRLVLGRYYLDEGDPGRALSVLGPLAERGSEDSEILRTVGDAYAQSGDPTRAIGYFEKVLVLSGPDPAVLNALAACHVATGNTARAIEFFQRSLEIAPDQPDIRSKLKELQGLQ
jgi:GWxTD domain-containing protein